MGKGTVKNPPLTASEVSRLLSYDPTSGEFLWKVDIGTAKAGCKAGAVDAKGNRIIRINTHLCSASRLAWLMMTGEWPIGRLARRNREPSDNRWENLCLPSDLIQPLTAERLREVVHYDPESGEFTWKLRIGVKAIIGARAGWAHSAGYVGLNVAGHKMFAHQAAWLYMTGEWPEHQIDHDNGKRSDNSWKNLRAATPTQNAGNSGKRLSNTSGFKGVTRSANGKRWVAFLGKKAGTKYLGTFDTPEEAHEAYIKSSREYWGDYANAG